MLEGEAGPYGINKPQRLVIATTDPEHLPELSTWYLTTNLPAPESQREREDEIVPADAGEVINLYGLRIWVEQSYKQVKQHLGWAEYQVRSDLAMRRHWQLVCCAFSLCWWALNQDAEATAAAAQKGKPKVNTEPIVERKCAKKKPFSIPSTPDLARGVEEDSRVPRTLSHALALLASLVQESPPPQLQALLDWTFQGKPLYLYC